MHSSVNISFINYRIDRVNEDIIELNKMLKDKLNKYEITEDDLKEINKYKKNISYLNGAIDELDYIKHTIENDT